MNAKTQSILAGALLLLNAAMALYIWPVNSRRSLALLITIAAFACVWFTCHRIAKARACAWSTSKSRREIVGSIIAASLILLGASTAIVLQDAGVIGDDIPKRMVGVIIGAVLVVMGNAMPKKLAPIDCNGTCATNTVRTQRLQRFMGWTFVLAGLIYMGIWVVVDLDKVGFAVLLSFPAAIAILIAVRMSTLRHARTKRRLDHPV